MGGISNPAKAKASFDIAAARKRRIDALSDEDLVKEAEARMSVNKAPASLNAIKHFRTILELGDEVELALRMLPAGKLTKVIGRQQELIVSYASIGDMNKHVLNLVSEQDLDACMLVRRFMEMDSAAGEEENVAPPPAKKATFSTAL